MWPFDSKILFISYEDRAHVKLRIRQPSLLLNAVKIQTIIVSVIIFEDSNELNNLEWNSKVNFSI